MSVYIESDILAVDIDAVIVDKDSCAEKICGYGNHDREMYYMHLETARNVYDKYIAGGNVDVILRYFKPECVKSDGFSFDGVDIKCDIITKLSIPTPNIRGGYLFTFYVPDIGEDDYEACSLLEKYYVDSWLIMVVDMVRVWLRKYLEKWYSAEGVFVSDTFGPGYYGMGIEQMGPLLQVLDSERVGVKYGNDGNMYPAKSCVGIYLVTEQKIGDEIKDCINCIGDNGGCFMCKNYRREVKI